MTLDNNTVLMFFIKSAKNFKESPFVRIVFFVIFFFTILSIGDLLINLTIYHILKGFFDNNSVDTLSILMICESLFYLLSGVLFIKYIGKFSDLNIKITKKPLKKSILYYFIVLILILGLIFYFIHLLNYFFNFASGFLGENHFVAYYGDFDIKKTKRLQAFFIGIKYILVLTAIDEIIFRKFVQTQLINSKFGLITSSLLASVMQTVPLIPFFFLIPNMNHFLSVLIVRFVISFILCTIYFRSTRLVFSYSVNVMVSAYIFVKQIVFTESSPFDLNTPFTIIKLSTIYISFFLLILIILGQQKGRWKKFNSRLNFSELLGYPQNYITKDSFIFSLVILVIIPQFLLYYLDNVYYIRSELDYLIVSILKIILLILIIYGIYKKIIKTFKYNPESNYQISNLAIAFKSIVSIWIKKVRKFFNFPIFEIFKKVLATTGKIIVVYALFLPFIYFQVQGTLKFSLLVLFNIQADISVDYSQHLLFTILNVTNTTGIVIGNLGFLFLKNVSQNFVFLPTTYYSEPIDLVYGILASLTWFLSVYLLFKLITYLFNYSKHSSKEKLKITILYFSASFLWMLFGFGLFRPSSFFPTPSVPPTGQQPASSRFISTDSFSDFTFFFLPFGYIILISLILFFILNIFLGRFKRKKNQDSIE